MTELEIMGKGAKAAARVLGSASTGVKNLALKYISEALIENAEKIVECNSIDIENARKNGLSEAIIDRLRLDVQRVKGMAKGVDDVIALQDPVGRSIDGSKHANGMTINKVTVPLGVIGIIYEARPNVTSDAAALCLKSGNAVILRGGKEAINSNSAIAQIMRAAVEKAGLPADCINFVTDTSRETASQMMRLNKYIDVLIPRGGAGLISTVVNHSTVPVIETGTGNCHTYVDKTADIAMAVSIVNNAKTSRPSVCNACESVLVHKDIADEFLPAMYARLREKDVTVKGDDGVCAILENAEKATEDDWGTEFLDYIISAKIVENIDEAIEHITAYGTGHSECIVTSDYASAQKFLMQIDAAAVYVNASTRFTDGGEFGLGAEIGISTQKLHARGPMGLNELTTVKYLVYGNGQIR
ncbi:MAG: glutamate-5-semialdehyde dehydrogenase [Clostridia bacterium]|nr:glutamate-5-semialdehyde dehydrogenase [Clostridia bacterium]